MKQYLFGAVVKPHNQRESRVLDVMQARTKYLDGPSGPRIMRELIEDVSVLYYLRMIDYEDVEYMTENIKQMCNRSEKVTPTSNIYKLG